MDKMSKEIDEKFVEMTSFITDHVEKFAAAFIQETGLDPTKVKMVQQRTDSNFGVKIWFEPFPKESEIEMYRAGQERALADLAERDAFIERLIEAGDDKNECLAPFSFDEFIKRKENWNAIVYEWEHRNDKPEEAGNCQLKEVGEIKLTAIFPEWKERNNK